MTQMTLINNFLVDVEPPMRVISATEYWTVTLSFQYSLLPSDEVKSIKWFHLYPQKQELTTSPGECSNNREIDYL